MPSSRSWLGQRRCCQPLPLPLHGSLASPLPAFASPCCARLPPSPAGFPNPRPRKYSFFLCVLERPPLCANPPNLCPPFCAAPYARQLLLEGQTLQDAQVAKIKKDLSKGFALQVGLNCCCKHRAGWHAAAAQHAALSPLAPAASLALWLATAEAPDRPCSASRRSLPARLHPRCRTALWPTCSGAQT